MSAEIPFTNQQRQRHQQQRPTNLYCAGKQPTKNNTNTNSLTTVNNISTGSNNSIEKSTLSSKSLTPSPNNITTKIPMSKFTSLTPSPGMLRRSTSLRLRGDRLFYTQSNGHHYVNNNSGYISRCDSGSSYFRPNTLSVNGESKGSVNTGPCSLRPTITERSPGHQKAARTPLTSRKNQGTTIKSPVKDNIQESPIRHRSLSLSLSTQTTSPHTPPVSPDRGFDQDDEDDLDSLHSYSSVASTASCDHAYVARNGTTFSGRKMKYVVHCSSHAGQTGDEYLTPTQRAQRQIKRLKSLLQQAKLELEQKDSDIFRLTKEVVELRLYKASLNSPDEKSNSSSDAVTVCENTPSSPPVPALLDMQSSCADSGHFEDLVNASPSHRDKAVGTDQDIENRDLERKKLIEYYENKLQELSRIHGNETQELKRQHNDRVEALLKTLSEVNERYCQLVPDYETAKERIRDLEKQLDDVSRQLKESDEKQRKMYLKVYGNKDTVDSSQASTSTSVHRVSVADLLHQLQVTQTELENIKAMYRRLVEARGSKTDLDPEVTLQFLKSAIYYFLTDKENHRGHLRAIESILGFTNVEIDNIHKANTL